MCRCTLAFGTPERGLLISWGTNMTTAVSAYAPTDFDFIIGNWRVKHRRLNQRLTGCTEWSEFDGESCTRKILGGFGNLEDNVISLPDGSYRAAALRSFDSVSKQWSIWWLDARQPGQLDTPVVGQFHNGIGVFYADDVFNGQPIRIRFLWRPQTETGPVWEQAFSPDAGVNWETNWVMQFFRLGN